MRVGVGNLLGRIGVGRRGYGRLSATGSGNVYLKSRLDKLSLYSCVVCNPYEIRFNSERTTLN